MAIPGTTSALIAAFVFGIVVNSASAGLFLNVKGHGSSIFRDGKRLVLVLFLLSAALWAQIDFITTLIDPTATASCQLGVIFLTIFDQLARFSVEQHLLWVINDGMKPGALQYILQALLAARLVLGGVFVGLSKSEFNTVCVPVSSILIVAIITVILDAVIIVGLAGQAISAGVFGKMQDGGQASSRGKAVVAVLGGLVIWMGTSVPMSLGVPGSDYLTRSTIPGGGLSLLIIIVIAFSDSLVTPEVRRDQERRIPEAPSPRMITTGRSISTSATNDYPPSRFEDLKTEQLSSLTAFVQPREVPHPGQPVALTQRLSQNLPTISNASAGQGVGGLPVQGALFPPIRANTEPQKPTAPRQIQQEQSKRAFFDSSKGPARSITVGGKLAISNPVLQQGGSNPLDKVATTDLATAAQMDKDRRALMAIYNDQTPPAELSANPLNANPERGLMQTTSTIRKEVAAAVSEPLRPDRPDRPDSEILSTGSATGAQLSPSSDELRRRSPRQTSPKSSVELQAAPGTPPVPMKSPGRTVPRQVTAPGPNPVIRPSRQKPASPEPAPEPLKTPLQRRPTHGLPMNPRSRSIRRPSPPEAGKSRQETVLFVNDIVYNDPTFVASIMEDAKDRNVKPALPSVIMPDVETAQDQSLLVPQVKALPEPPTTASSVVHRPRPIPRKPSEEEGDAFYPPTGHKKSRSLGNIMQRKSILQSNPGSPTTLPPLPPPPMSARRERPHPNDTKSMTYSEKVNLLFPALEDGEKRNRRSSVPDLPSSFMDDSATLTENDTRDMHDRYSKRTTTSIRTRSIFDEQDPSLPREASMATYRGLVNDGEQEELQGERGSRPNGAKRASSPVLPIFGDLRSASTADYDDDVTNIGSIYSPRHVQQVGLAVHQARTIEVTKLDRPGPDNRGVSAFTNGEEMTIMLDTSVARDIQQAQDDLNSPVDDGSPVEETTSTRSSGPWHRRVGESTLSFSGHSDKRSSRRGPPPTPLALSDRPTQAKQVAIAKAAEPSPLPSPEEALQLIQAQLKKYEQPDRASIESPGRQALLNDLEAEMGQQESRWLGMQNRFTQDSMTTIDVSPTAESRRTSAAIPDMSSEPNLSRNSSTRSNMAAERSAYRRTRQASIASSIISFNNEGDDVPFGSRASLWQKRLAAAHQEFMHTASELDRKRSRNFLALSSNLGSPTPPDSDESETEIESRRNLAAVLARRAKEEEAKKQAAANSLWTKGQPEEEQVGLMWVRPEKPYHVPVVEPPLPGLSVRPAQRKESSELSVESNQLWQKATSDKPSSSSKLWVASVEVAEPEQMPAIESAPAPEVRNFYNPSIRRSQTVSGRPLTQRPPRRSKRITALPDIIEDPVPLPDKRDTLGIFQFPWGEKSDIASVPQRPTLAAMPGTMSTGGVRGTLDARSRELEQTEYSSSFFDEYEEDDDSDSMGSESDDGFDETTLFEIASLLKANNVPSTNSFFGNPRDSRDSGDSLLDQYLSEDQRSTEPQEERNLAALEEEMEGLQMMRASMRPLQPQSLWEDDSEDEEAQRGSHGKGLPQPEDWHRYDETSETIRAKPRLSQQPASVDSDSLWVQQPLKASISNSPMWTPQDSPTKPTSSETALQEDSSSQYESSEPSSVEEEAYPEASASSSPLWKAEEQPQRGQHGVGLPQPEDFSTYDAVKLTARAKPRQVEPAVIESVNLWEASEPETEPVQSKTWTPKTKSLAPVSQTVTPARQVARHVQQVSKMLWSAPASPKQMNDGGLFSANSGRTDFRTTVQLPAAVQLDRKAQTPARQPLDLLTSTTLWTTRTIDEAPRNWIKAIASPSSPKRQLWSAPSSPKEVNASGLFDPKTPRSSFRTTTQAPAALESSRKARSPEVKSLDRLTSTTLWVSAPQVNSERNWISSKATPSPNRLLWSAPASPKETTESGLFTRSGRTEFRTTSQAPAAIVMDRKLRSAEVKSLDRLTSDTLWVSAAQVAIETNWIAVRGSPERRLWSAPASPKEFTSSGLFTKSARADFKTSSKAPAAIEIERKARPVEEKPLEQLNSTSLWVPDNKSESERHWISSANASGASTPNPSRIVSTPEMWLKALEEAVAASYPAAALEASKSVSRVSPVTPEQWLQALDEAVAASYPIRQSAARKAPIQASPSDWAAALAEAIALSYSKATSFDVSKRHPVFAASSLASKASVIHPAAIGYTADVAAVHPVFFGSGAGKPVHPAVPSKTAMSFDVSRRHPVFAASSLVSKASLIHPAAIGYTADIASVHPVFFGSGVGKPVHPAVPSQTATESRTVTAPVPEEVDQTSARSSVVPKGRGRRITAMASMFEDASQNAPVSRSFSISRQSSASSLRRMVTPPRVATPEPEPVSVPEPQVEEAQEVVPVQEYEMDPALLAQIEALEQERLFAEQWAAGSFEPIENVPESTEGLLEPSPMIVSAAEEAAPAPTQLSKADQLALEMFTPVSESAEPVLLEAKTYEAPSTPVKQQALSAEELGEQMFTPVDVTPKSQLAPLSIPGSEPKTPKTPTAQPTTPKSGGGWFSSISARLGRSPPRGVEQEAEVPQVPQLQRSNTVTSTVSAVSPSDTITLRDSLISVDSERGKSVTGSKIQIRY